jgi:hypothetical protein
MIRVLDFRVEFWVLVAGLIDICLHCILGFFNPFDVLGNAFWSINLVAGTVRIPGYYIYNLNLPFGNTGLELSSVSWDGVRINWRWLQSIQVAIDRLIIQVEQRSKGPAISGSETKQPKISSSSAPKQDASSQLPNVSLPWWSQWIPSIELKFNNSVEFNIMSVLQLSVGDIQLSIGSTVNSSSSKPMLQVGCRFESVEFLVLNEPNGTTKIDCSEDTVTRTLLLAKHRAPLFLQIVSLSITGSVGKGEAVTAKVPLALAASVGDVTCSFDVGEVNSVCHAVHDFMSLLNPVCSLASSEIAESTELCMYSSRSLRNYKWSIMRSRQVFNDLVDQVDASISHGHTVTRSQTRPTGGAFHVDMMDTLALKLELVISQFSVKGCFAVLDPSNALSVRGPRRSLRNPATIVQSIRQRREEYFDLLSAVGLRVAAETVSGDADANCWQLGVALQRISSCSAIDTSITDSSSGDAALTFEAQLQRTDYKSVKYGFRGKASGNLGPLCLEFDPSLLSQSLHFVTNVVSAAKGASPTAIFRPLGSLEGFQDVVTNHFLTRFRPDDPVRQEPSSETVTKEMSDIRAFLLMNAVFWQSFMFAAPSIRISLIDSRLQFSNVHDKLLTVVIAGCDVKVESALSTDSVSGPRHNTGHSGGAEDTDFEESVAVESNSQIPVEALTFDNFTTTFTMNVDDVCITNDCNARSPFEPCRPPKYGKFSRSLSNRVIVVERVSVVQTWRTRLAVDGDLTPSVGAMIGSMPSHFQNQVDVQSSSSHEHIPDMSYGAVIDSWLTWFSACKSDALSTVPFDKTSALAIDVASISMMLDQFDAALLSACGAVISRGSSKPNSGFSGIPVRRYTSSAWVTDALVARNMMKLNIDSADVSLRWVNCSEGSAEPVIVDRIDVTVPKVIVDSISVGSHGLFSEMTVLVDSDVRIVRQHSESGAQNTVQLCSRSAGGSLLVSSIKFPHEIWHCGLYSDSFSSLPVHPIPALIRSVAHTVVSIGDVVGDLDSNSFELVHRIRGGCSAEDNCVTVAMSHILNGHTWQNFTSIESALLRCRRLEQQQEETVDKASSCLILSTKSPVSSTLIEVQSVSIRFEQFRAPLMDFSIRSLNIAMVSFGPHLNQTSGSFSSLKCLDRTMPKAIHQNIFTNIDGSAGMTNKLEFHITSMVGECSLLEFRGAFLRIVYLQRPVMACVMYFRDYFFPAIGLSFQQELNAWTVRNGYETVVAKSVANAPYSAFGQFRFSIELTNCEAHLPTNASGTDCLTAIFPRLYAFKSAFELGRQYCMGPHLSSGVWISELNRVLASTKRLHLADASAKTRSRSSMDSWKLQHRWTQLFAPPSENRTVKVFKLDVECENAAICSWCSRNEVGSGINLKVFITFEGVPPAVDGMYASVFQALSYDKHDRNNRNKIVVDISAEEVDWTISQGQYMAVVYLIQQNIPEVQTVVKDVNNPPVNKLVDLDATAYGKYSLERRVPLFTTVPIHIKSGRLTGVDNDPEYLTNLARLLYVDDNFQATKSETFPLWSNHHIHRARMFTGCNLEDDEFWTAIKRQRGSRPRRQSRRPSTFEDPTAPSELELATIFRIYFKQLEIDFYKLHYGAGAGIDVAAGNIIIACSKFDSGTGAVNTEEDEEIFTHFGVDLEETSPETVIFAPKTMPQLCRSTAVVSPESGSPSRAAVSSPKLDLVSDESPSRQARVAFSSTAIANVSKEGDYSGLRSDRRKLQSLANDVEDPECDAGSEDSDTEYDQYRTARSRPDGDWSWHGDNVIHRGADGMNIGEFEPQLRYRQQGVANLRRCVVDIANCVLVAHIRPIMAAVSYFVDPISLTNMRGNELLLNEGIGPLDFKAGLDVEVHTKSTVIAIPKFSTKDGMSVLCVQSDVDYIHAFRGFKEAGPAKVTIDVWMNIYSIFITPIHEIKVAGAESLIDPCCLQVGSVWNLHCPEDHLKRNSKVLAEHMTIQSMPMKPSKSEKAFPVRFISVKMAPRDEGDTDAPDSPIGRAPSSVQRKITGTFTDQEDEEEAKEVVQQVLRFKFSLKDVFFVLSSVKQLGESWHTRRQQKPLRERYYFLFDGENAFRDIQYLERNTTQNPNCFVDRPALPDEGDQDVVTQSCDLDIILKNNTYNLKVGKVEFKNFNLSYSKAFDRLHMATGLTVAAWTFNENADVWEPIIESTEGSCIAASDTSIMTNQSLAYGQSPMITSGGQQVTLVPPVRYDVFCNPVCINAPESTTVSLIRKFSLADVVTTSSIHLPPYRVVNELGVTVLCTLSIGSVQIYESEIAIGNFLPIERREIAKASYQSNRRAHHRRMAAMSISASADNDHKLGVLYELDNEAYNSKEPLPIDREGIFAYDMKTSTVITKLNRRTSVGPGSSSLLEDDSAGEKAAAAAPAFSTVKMHGGATMIVNHVVGQNLAAGPTKRSSDKFGANLPYSMVSMRMKDDGGRELVLRSVLSLKNLSSRLIYVCIRRGAVTVEAAISPGMEWNVPIQVAHPKASLFIKQTEKGVWYPVLATLGSLIVQGIWGAPTKLKAEVCCCPAEKGSTGSDWVLMLRPEVRDTKGGSSGALGSRTFIPVKYPAKDTSKNRRAQLAAEMAAVSGLDASSDSMFGLSELYSSSFASSQYRSIIAQPMCFQLIAPLQLCNLLSQPLLYRIAENEGYVVSEGTLLPGEVVDVHSVVQLFAKRIFISIRLLNYCWSKWTKILSKNNPFPATEKLYEIPLTSMNLLHQSSDLTLPTVDVICSMRENLVRISCPVIIRNCTGLQLDIAEAASLDMFTPHSSQLPIETVVAMKLRSSSAAADADLALMPSAAAAGHEHHAPGSSDFALNNPADELGAMRTAMYGRTPTPGQEEDAGGEFEGTYFTTNDAVRELDASTFEESFLKETPGESVPDPSLAAPLAASIVPNFGIAPGVLGQRSILPKITTINLIIHMPYDHMAKIEVVASSDWTLASVFAKIMSKLAVNKVHRSHYSYVFLPWEAGRDAAGVVAHSPAVEANLFGTRSTSTQASHAHGGQNSSMRSTGSGPGDANESQRIADDDDDDDDDDDVPTTPSTPTSLHQDTKQAELLSAHIAKKAEDRGTSSKPSFFSRRSISGMFNSSTSSSSTSQSHRHSISSSSPSMALTDPATVAQADGLPPSIAFGMIADCSLNGLSFETKVDQLPCYRLRLCHITEYRIFEQIQNIKSETVVSEGLMTMFRGAKVKRRSVFEKYEGDLPFNPKRSMLGFSPTLCLRVAHLTGWSSPMELYSANFGSGTDYMSLQSAQYSSSRMQDVHFEFGAYAERGKGFYQNILCVTIVPKHIIVFKMRYPMQVRQLGDLEHGRLTTLKPGSIQNYHYPVIRRDKYLQIRRAEWISSPRQAAAQSPKPQDDNRYDWYGEIDITRLGIVYVKLRDPLFIVKVQVEVVGASLIATFAPQDKQWPPYRIDNTTSLMCRYRQIMPQPVSTAPQASQKEKDSSPRANKSVESTLPSDFGIAGDERVPWDELPKGESSAYAWDYPISGEKLIRLEFTQGPAWVGFDVSLDDVSKPRVLSVLRPLAGLSNPQAEGYLKFRDAASDTFVSAYCILKGDAIYVFRDQSRTELIEVVCLARSSYSTMMVGAKQARKDSIKLSSVFKYVENNWTNSIMGSSKGNANIDMNRARILLLMLADALGVFKTVPRSTKASKEEARERAESMESDSSDGTRGTNSISVASKASGVPGMLQNMKPKSPEIAVPAPETQGLPMTEAPDQTEVPVTEGNEESEPWERTGFAPTDREQLLGSADEIVEHLEPTNFDDDDELSEDSRSDSGSSLREQLQLGVPIDQLLEYISAFTFEMFDMVHALMNIEEATDMVSAKLICGQLVAQGILVMSTAQHGGPNEAAGTPSNSDSNNISTASSSDNVNKSNSATNSANNSVDLLSAANRVMASESAGAKTIVPRMLGKDDHVLYDGRDSEDEDDEHSTPRSEDDGDAVASAITSRASMTVTGLDLKELRQFAPAEVLANALTMSTKLTFGLPSLFPELAALAAARDEILQNAKDRMTLIGGVDENEVNGFTIFRAEGSAVHFQCSSEHEFLGWIQGCRQNIEQVWCRYVSSLPNHRSQAHSDLMDIDCQRSDCFVAFVEDLADPYSPIGFETGNISVETFKLKLNLKVRADGPTKVLEIAEADPTIDTRILSVVGSLKRRTPAGESGKSLAAITEDSAENELSPVENAGDKSPKLSPDKLSASSHELVPSPHKRHAPTPEELKLQEERQQLLREQQYALFVSVKVESVAVSLIDAEPTEVIFLSFRDIRLSVERTYQRLTIAATVQDLNASNQLLNPSFPVALHPRRAAAGAGAKARLMLPGLHQIDDDEFPALHLFVQQKLYHNDKSVAGIVAANGGLVNDKYATSFAPAVGGGSVRPGSVRGEASSTTSSAVDTSSSHTAYNSSADAVINVKESKLMYFEMATVWLAPMALNIDEELVVRLMRFTNVVRSSLRKPDMGSLNRLHEEILSIQHHGSKSWGTMDRSNISNGFVQFLDACKTPYMNFTPLGKVSIFLYFSLLQLHPLDIVMNLHSSPTFPLTSSEMTIVTLLSQIDGARLCLNALVTEHAFGSQSIIMDIIVKHYKASLWRQFHKLIGSTDIVEGSVGLVANLGSGVYDLFYEPIEGLLDENGSFLNGLSKGGRSLASRTIGGTSGFTSKITGGIGKGVSFLTMDRDFYRNRASRRLNKTTSVSEGIYVGTKELGKNIVEGFSGIVVSPYRGWEEGGGVGFGVGIAKGILGVALKPAVGVFDLASRATEGIRHTAFGSEVEAGKRLVVRTRIPRSFGRSNVLVPYNNEAAAGQYLSDKLVNFNRDSRVMIVYHQHFIRTLAEPESESGWVDPLQRTLHNSNDEPDNLIAEGVAEEAAPEAMAELVAATADDAPQAVTAEPLDSASSAEPASSNAVVHGDTMLSDLNSKIRAEAMSKLIASSNAGRARASLLMYKDEGSGDFRHPTEAWGMTVGNSYVCLVSAYRISLTEIRSTTQSKNADFRFIWSCPASCMDQLYSDARGDLILSVGSSVAITGPWNSPHPVVTDFFAQNFVILQSLLEQSIGPRLARLQPLAPSGGLIQKDLYKRYSSGIKSILLSPTKQTFQLFGYVLYEYTANMGKKPTTSTGGSKDASGIAGGGNDGNNNNSGSGGNSSSSGGAAETGTTGDKKKEPKPDDSVTAEVGNIFAKPIPKKQPQAPTDFSSSSSSSSSNSAGSSSGKRRNSILSSSGGSSAEECSSPPAYSTIGVPEGVLTYVYPLVDVVLLGPYKEDNGKYSLSLSRKDGARMRVLKREHADDHLMEHHKSMLTIVFPDSKSAWKWRHSIESHIVRHPADVVPTGPLIPDKRKTILGTIGMTKVDGDEAPENSILGMLVIPASGMPSSAVEALKVEIAKTLLLSRR